MNAIKAGQSEKNRKIFLYSGHETNVAALLQTLGVYKSHVPQYTSAVIVELYELNGQHYVKVPQSLIFFSIFYLLFFLINPALILTIFGPCNRFCTTEEYRRR